MEGLLLRKQIINKAINPKKLGYVFKDGTIKFGSEEAVFEYAKNSVMQGLKAQQPYEKRVYWKDCRVLGINKGNKYSAPLPKNMPEGTSGMHGHIHETELSAQDYLVLMCNNQKEEIAMCPSGRYSKFTRLQSENSNNKSTQQKIIKTYKKAKLHEYFVTFKSLCKMSVFIIELLFKKIRGVGINEDMIKDFQKISTSGTKDGVEYWKNLSGEKIGAIFESNLKY